MNKRSKTVNAREWIDRLLASIAPGDPLPSLRTMMDESGLTRTFLMQALREYEGTGAVKIVPRSGIYRQESAPKEACGIVDLVACHERNYLGTRREEFFPELKELLCDQAFHYNCAVRLHRVKQPDPPEMYRPLAALADSRGFVLMHTPSEEIAALFAASGKPVVHLMPDLRLAGGMQIIDNSELIPRIGRSLLAAGYRQIAYLHEQDDAYASSEFHRERLDSFVRLLAENGLAANPEWLIFGRSNSAGMREAVKRMFARRPYPEALIANDRYMPVVYEHLYHLGLRIGRDIALIGHDGLSLTDELTPALTSLTVPRGGIVEQVWELLTGGNTRENITLPVPAQWRPGESFKGKLL